MSQPAHRLDRRRLLKTAVGAGALAAAPLVLPRSVLAAADAPPPSERIYVGGIGVVGRGLTVVGDFLMNKEVTFVAVADVQAWARKKVKEVVDGRQKNTNCAMYRDFRELLDRPDIDVVIIATRQRWHGLASIYAAKAGKDVYAEKPCTNNIVESLALRDTFARTGRLFQAGTQRRTVPHFIFAVELARGSKLGKLTAVHAAGGVGASFAHAWGLGSKSATTPPEPPKEEFDWDICLGPDAWRPNPGRYAVGYAGGLIDSGCLEWGAHCVDLCQWANGADQTAPLEYHAPQKGRSEAMYANGCKLVVRGEGWLGLGSCPVRFEGEKGWVEVGDSGKIMLSSPELAEGMDLPKTGGYPAHWHVRNLLDCVKSREQPAANAAIACQTHIACHAVNVAAALGRTVKYDPKKNEFIDDEAANRLRGAALRDPWRI